MRIPVAIYPFCAEILPVVKMFDELQDNYSIKLVISPSGFALSGHDASYACNHPSIGYIVTDHFEFESAEWNTLILFRPVLKKELEDALLEEAAKQALLHEKRVIYLHTNRIIPEKIRILASEYPYKVEIKNYLKENEIEIEEKYHLVEVPIVLVGGLLEEADTLEVLIQLVVKMRSEGLHVVVFSKHPIGELFGFYNLDSIWNREEYSESDKITGINNFINCVVKKERPDLVLLESPDAVMKYNDSVVNNFGIQTYMLCQAVTPDRFVCCMPFELAFSYLLDKMSHDMEKRLGSPITAVHASNILMDIGELKQRHDIEILRVNMQFVRKQIKLQKEHSSIPIFNVVDEGINGLYATLSGEVEENQREENL